MSFRSSNAFNNDSNDDDDRGAHLKLAQRHRKIVAGKFKGRKVFEPEVSAPGVVGQVAISFITTNGLPKESRLTCVLPDHGWCIPSDGLNTVARLPSGHLMPMIKTKWHQATRTLEFTFLNESIRPETPVILLLSGVSTPQQATSQGEAVLTSYEKLVVRNTVPPSTRGGQIIDGPCIITIPKVLPGQITGSKRWRPFNCCPGAISDVSLSFTINGTIPMGGKLLIELPADGWDMPDQPQVVVRTAKYHNIPVLGTWNRLQHTLEVTLGENTIASHTSVTLTIAEVKNPSKETLVGSSNGTARLTTLSSASGGVIDGPCKLEVACISELRDCDFHGIRQILDEDTAAGIISGDVIPVDKISEVLYRAGLRLTEEMFQSLVLANLSTLGYVNNNNSTGESPPSESNSAKMVTKKTLINVFGTVYAPAYKYGQELRVACGRGQVDQVREWIRRGCDPNASDGSGWCALHYTTDYGQLEVLEAIIELTTPTGDASNSNFFQLNVNARDAHGWTPLMCAAANGHTAIIDRLVAIGADVSLASVEGRTALHWAGSRDMEEAVQRLLVADADPNLQDRCGWSVLHCAMLHDASASCIKALVDGGAKQALTDKLQYTAQEYAPSKL